MCYLKKQKLNKNLFLAWMLKSGGGGTDFERGYGDVLPWKPPFYTSPIVCKGPISNKRAEKSVHKTPFWKKMKILASTT